MIRFEINCTKTAEQNVIHFIMLGLHLSQIFTLPNMIKIGECLPEICVCNFVQGIHLFLIHLVFCRFYLEISRWTK